MKTTALFATNNNELYLPYKNPISQAWENLGFEALCINTEEEKLIPEGEIPFGNQAQMIRVLWPALFPDKNFIITDIDMLPLNKEYFHKISLLPKDKEIINVSADAYAGKQNRLPICYFVGKGSTFSEITGIKTVDDVINVMRKWWSLGKGWDTDELCFTDEILKSLKEKKISFSGYSRGWVQGRALHRIDRDLWRYNKESLLKGEYIDSHLLRPLTPNYQNLFPLFESVGVSL